MTGATHCEGSGEKGHDMGHFVMCACCGAHLGTDFSGVTLPHERWTIEHLVSAAENWEKAQ